MRAEGTATQPCAYMFCILHHKLSEQIKAETVEMPSILAESLAIAIILCACTYHKPRVHYIHVECTSLFCHIISVSSIQVYTLLINRIAVGV